MLRVTDVALLIAGFRYRDDTFEGGVYSILSQVQREQGLTDDQTAHIYASVVEKCNEESRVSELEQVILAAFKSRPR